MGYMNMTEEEINEPVQITEPKLTNNERASIEALYRISGTPFPLHPEAVKEALAMVSKFDRITLARQRMEQERFVIQHLLEDGKEIRAAERGLCLISEMLRLLA